MIKIQYNDTSLALSVAPRGRAVRLRPPRCIRAHHRSSLPASYMYERLSSPSTLHLDLNLEKEQFLQRSGAIYK